MKKIILGLCIFLSSMCFSYAATTEKKQSFLVIQCSSYHISLTAPLTCSGDGIKDQIETTFKTLYHAGWKIDMQVSGGSPFMFFLIKQKQD